MKKDILEYARQLDEQQQSPFQEETDCETYVPPPFKGYIYITITKKNSDVINCYVSWGPWSKRDLIDVSSYHGVVIKLQHYKEESVPLEIESTGNIENIEQLQESFKERHWKALKYKMLSW